MRLRVRPRLLRVLFMRKEKHRPVGASGFFLDRPEEGHGEGEEGQGGGGRGRSWSSGSSGQDPGPSSTLVTNLFPASSSKSRPETREGLPGVCCSLRPAPAPTPAGRAPAFPQGRATASFSPHLFFLVDREAWHAAVHGVAKSQTRLSDGTELN